MPTILKTIHSKRKVLDAMSNGCTLEETPHGARLRNAWAQEEHPVERRIITSLEADGSITRTADGWVTT